MRSCCRRWSRILEVRICKAPPGHDQPRTDRRRPGRKGESGSDEKKDDGLLPYPTDTWLTQGKHSVDEAGSRSDEHQDEVGVAGNHANEGCSANAQRGQDHGKEAGIVDMLLGAKADGKGSAGSDQSRTRVAQPDAEGETDRYGKNKDEISTKGLRFPIEDEAIGEERGGGRRRRC